MMKAQIVVTSSGDDPKNDRVDMAMAAMQMHAARSREYFDVIMFMVFPVG